MPRSQIVAAELEPVDLMHGQVDEAVEMENVLRLNISGKDKAAYALSYDNNSDYSLCADSLPQSEVPTGQLYHFRWISHTVYPGVSRGVWLYLPAGAEQAGSVNLLVCQDGPDYFGPLVNATTVLDNLAHRGEIPMTVGLFVAPGEQGPGYPHFCSLWSGRGWHGPAIREDA